MKIMVGCCLVDSEFAICCSNSDFTFAMFCCYWVYINCNNTVDLGWAIWWKTMCNSHDGRLRHFVCNVAVIFLWCLWSHSMLVSVTIMVSFVWTLPFWFGSSYCSKFFFWTFQCNHVSWHWMFGVCVSVMVSSDFSPTFFNC